MRKTPLSTVLVLGGLAATGWLLSPIGFGPQPTGSALAFASAADPNATPPATAPTTAPTGDGDRPQRDRDGRRRDGDRDGDRGGGDRGDRGGDRPRGPSAGPGDGQGPGQGMNRGNRRQFFGPGLPRISTDEPTPEEWADVREFWLEHSPNRLNQFEQFEREVQAATAAGQEDRRQRMYRGARQRMAMRYRMVQELEKDDQQKELVRIALQQMETEDDAFVAFRELQTKPDDHAAAGKFKEMVARYIDASLTERETRLTMLRELVQHEEQRLAKDREGREALLERQAGRFEREFGAILGTRPTTKPGG